MTLNETEAALCVWEELLQPHYQFLRNRYGACNLRFHAITIGVWANSVYAALVNDHNYDHDPECFDWDFVPKLLQQIRWHPDEDQPPKIPTTESGLYHYLLAYHVINPLNPGVTHDYPVPRYHH